MLGNWLFVADARQHGRLARRRHGQGALDAQARRRRRVELVHLGADRDCDHVIVGDRRRRAGRQHARVRRVARSGDRRVAVEVVRRRRGPASRASRPWPNAEASLKSAGAPWQPPTYDPELNLLYVPTGQATPTYNGKSREGANLYTCSIVALNADTGKMAWYYQTSPHDTHDWDATEVAILVDGTIDGQPRKLLAQANRNGYFFLLDRTNGKAVVVKPFALSNSYLGVDNGMLVPNPAKEGSPGGTLVFPTSDGAVNFPGAVVQPRHRPVLHQRHRRRQHLLSLARSDRSDRLGRGQEWHGGLFDSRLMAIDYRTGDGRSGSTSTRSNGWGSSQQPGVLTTGGGLLFSGDPSGNLIAFDAATGEILWHAQLGRS